MGWIGWGAAVAPLVELWRQVCAWQVGWSTACMHERGPFLLVATP